MIEFAAAIAAWAGVIFLLVMLAGSLASFCIVIVVVLRVVRGGRRELENGWYGSNERD